MPELQQTPGRQVWFNYWDTCLTYEKSYLARLHHVHLNAVKHGLATRPENYPFRSYRWFVEKSDEEFRRQVFSQAIDRIQLVDDF